MAKSVAVSRTGATGVSVWALAPYILWPLLAAGLAELFLYRMLSRVGVHIPKEGLVLDAYDALVRLGSFAFNVSSVLVFFALGLLILMLVRRKDSGAALLAMLLIAFGSLSLLLTFVEEGYSTKFGYGLLSAAIMVLVAGQAWADRRQDTAHKAAVGLMVLAYLAAQYYLLANQGYQALGLAATPPGTARALEVAEALVVTNAFLAFWVWSGVRRGLDWRPSWLQLLAAVLLAVVFLGAQRGEDSSTAAILSLWTLGLTLYLPLPVYVLALALYGAALAGCLAQARDDPRRRWDAVALGLLPVAGLILEMTYLHLVALVALLLLALGLDETGYTSIERSARLRPGVGAEL